LPTFATSLRPASRHAVALSLAVASGLVVLVWHSTAAAWGYVEHRWLGRTVYEQVCKDLRQAIEAPAPGQRALTADEQARFRIACEQVELNSTQYGQFTALSGDHLGPDETQGIRSNIAAKDLVGYLLRASHNADHFHPLGPLEWRSRHEQALLAALKAKDTSTYLKQVDAFWTAFYLNAYGDHFLQDAFSAGHGGFNRPSSTPSAANSFHNAQNEQGRILSDGAGRRWLSYGDDRLFTDANAEGRARVWWAAKASVRDFILTFVFGRRSRQREQDASLRVPTLSRALCGEVSSPQLLVYWANRNRQIDDKFNQAWLAEGELALRLPERPDDLAEPRLPPDCEESWSSLLLVQEPADYAVAHTFGVTEFGRINDYDHTLALTYSFSIYKKMLQYGMDVGWYSSTRADGNAGVLLGPTASLPLGGKYGTVLAWDVDAKLLILLPALNHDHSTAFVQHLAPSLGLAMSLQAGKLNLRFSAGPSLSFSNELKVNDDRWNTPGIGWYAQFGIQLINSPRGGGPMRPPRL